ncbi:uncharacterized protein LOC129786669 isoform X1 [Lutzomyia longipalpis]|uniref:uncharacterized protein LOC129786669 isoform X1 n=1 Tax=Lutzomyia longipalpis TaxID=7200 RepID=UPI00248438D0|nr:uncharacterized protein LOC129786669 isoform X1 [Lutzomyia longipalpis]
MVETTRQEDTTPKAPAGSSTEDHYQPSVRMLDIPKCPNGSCGFHLSRSKWDPYPWVSGVDKESPAEVTGLKAGDCVLEVNSEDVLGMRIAEIANMVKSRSDRVTLLLWSTGLDPQCTPDSLCCGPMPQNLERLSASMSTILAAMECPVCMDTIPPPAIQCQNGHLVCAKCRMRADKCPVCREKYHLSRSLIAEQVYNSIRDAFNLHDEMDGKLREKLFGAKAVRATSFIRTNNGSNNKSSSQSPTQKLLAKLMGKATSLDNLSSTRHLTPLAEDNVNLKTKSFSSSEIFIRPEAVSVMRGPSAVTPTLGTRRPPSCHTSTESVIEIVVPKLENSFRCPSAVECTASLTSAELRHHVLEVHGVPLLAFGTASAEISLPPRTPVENACLLLQLEQKIFWLRLDASQEDLFTSALLQAPTSECSKYLLEVVVQNNPAEKLKQRQLITRNPVYSLQNHSWHDILHSRKGILFTKKSIASTFPSDSDTLILKATVKTMEDLE